MMVINWFVIDKESQEEDEGPGHHDNTFDEDLKKAEEEGKARLDAIRKMKESSMNLKDSEII